MSNLSTIVSFFQSKGLSRELIAGIVGNLRIESGFDPTAYNSGEGAIGIAQWEGGRKINLENWAHSHGGSATDLHMQLSFLWHEMHTTEASAWDQVRQANTASEAASLWDKFYERSSGEARMSRIFAAVSFYRQGNIPGGDYHNHHTSISGGSGGSLKPQRMTMTDYSGVDNLGDLLSRIPELHQLVRSAMDKGWSAQRFENEVENSHWWRNHSDTARAAVIARINDPATWQQRVNQTEQQIHKLAQQLGMTVTAHERHAIAVHALFSGNDSNQAWLTDSISNHQNYSHLHTLKNLHGGMAATAQQLAQLENDYGFRWNPAVTAMHAQNILDGSTTIDTYKQRAIRWAKSAFPGLAKDIEGGATVRDLADPYVQSMSQILELTPGRLNLYTPQIRRALQGYRDPHTKEQVPQNLSDFEKQLREDPRWQYTQNAKDTMSSALLKLGADFGFGPEG